MYDKVTKDDIKALAREMVDSWDMDDLVYFATNKMEEHLSSLSDANFWLNYKIYHGEDEDE